MTELIVLLIFAVLLFLCIILDIPLVIALVLGLILFFVYGLIKKYTFKELLVFSVSGIKTVKNILLAFVLIGMITALWRACGVIPYVVYHAISLFDPRIMVLLSFLICSFISFLTGTAFGTAATVGVICASAMTSMGVPIAFSGGAVLAGSYFGDRCSPMSTSALLVSSLTKTDIYKNMGTMFKTSVVPFVLACGIYALMGLGLNANCDTVFIKKLFSDNFSLNIITVIPAAVIIILSVFKVNVKITMGVSIVCAALICVFVQDMPVTEVLKTAVHGFSPENAELSSLLSGGGILSMVNVFLIVCISSCYSGIFKGTGLISGAKGFVCRLSGKTTPFLAVLLTSLVSSFIACNQSLTIMLTHQLAGDAEKDPYIFASHLEDTAVVIAPLIPWSIAGAVPLASVSAPLLSIVFACYLYLIPLWNLIVSFHNKRKKAMQE